MCGTVSFKRGEAFYRANKVTVENYGPDGCEATVAGMEDFHVTIKKDEKGGLLTKCSCPALASFQMDCQHIAAVLLSIYELQRQGEIPNSPSEFQSDSLTNQALTEGLLTLFNAQPKRSSGHQLHFENRQVLDAEFTCKPVTLGEGRHMFGIKVKIGPTNVQNIRDFLKHVKDGRPSLLSNSFTFDPNLHCFQKETDALIQQLIQVIHDEDVYVDELLGKSNYVSDHHTLLIPPSSWDRLFPILERVPLIKLEYGGNVYAGLHVSNEPLSLQFDFAEAEDKGYQLKIEGLNRLVVLNSYRSVLSEGKLIQLKSEDCKRLSDLKQLLDGSGTNQISIPQEQVSFFLEKVVPGLKKLGNVQISDSMYKQLVKTPLIAKVYLDRVKNRLLVGLEFHYENIMINPLEPTRDIPASSTFVRDMEKEEEILQLWKIACFPRRTAVIFYIMKNWSMSFCIMSFRSFKTLAQIYATTAVRNRIFRGNARPKISVKMKKERTNWLEFKFELDGIPEKQIREVLLALEEKRKYYRLRNGSILSLETREFEEMNRFLNALPEQHEELESGLKLPFAQGLQLLDSVDDRDVFTLEESFLQFLENVHNPDGLEFEVPKSLDPILRDYQKDGYKWMKTLAHYGFGGILADDMGLG